MEDNQLSAVKLAEKIGIASRNIESNMKKLKEYGILVRKGSPKNGYWEIADKDLERIGDGMYYLIVYAGMILLILASAIAVLTGKTILPRWMFAFHMIIFQILFVLIPDARKLLGAEVSTWDFVLSQGSGNAALCIWMKANAIWARKKQQNSIELHGTS